MDFCDKLDKIVEDDNYVAFISTNFIRFCKTYRQCQVVSTPFEVSQMFGSGWMFAKRSPFYSLFNQYFASLREKGVLNRITDSYDARRFFPEQECPRREGKPIDIKGSISSYVIVLLGAALSMMTLL